MKRFVITAVAFGSFDFEIESKSRKEAMKEAWEEAFFSPVDDFGKIRDGRCRQLGIKEIRKSSEGIKTYVFGARVKGIAVDYEYADTEEKAVKAAEQYFSGNIYGKLRNTRFEIADVQEWDDVNDQRGRTEIKNALEGIDKWFREHPSVETPLGTASTRNGYRINEIKISGNRILISVSVLDRIVRERDAIRGGDEIYFRYNINKGITELGG